MNSEKTLQECARDGCEWCGYVLGYISYQGANAPIFPSQLAAALVGANQSFTCKQASIVEYETSRRIFNLARAHQKRPARTI